MQILLEILVTLQCAALWLSVLQKCCLIVSVCFAEDAIVQLKVVSVVIGLEPNKYT